LLFTYLGGKNEKIETIQVGISFAKAYVSIQLFLTGVLTLAVILFCSILFLYAIILAIITFVITGVILFFYFRLYYLAYGLLTNITNRLNGKQLPLKSPEPMLAYYSIHFIFVLLSFVLQLVALIVNLTQGMGDFTGIDMIRQIDGFSILISFLILITTTFTLRVFVEYNERLTGRNVE